MKNQVQHLVSNNIDSLFDETLKQFSTDLRVIKKIFENMHEGVVITNEKAEIIYANKAFEEVTKYSRREAIGENPRILQSGLHEPLFYKTMWTKLIKDGVWKGEIWNKRKTGEIYPEWLEIYSVSCVNGEKTYYIALFMDISKRKQAKELSFIDQLTGISNRAALNLWMESLLKESQTMSQKFAVLYLDLDRFKLINDSLGHKYGDELLRQFSFTIRDQIGESDFIARLGGDEFVVVLCNLNNYEEDYVQQFCKKIIKKLQSPFDIFDEELYITASIGVSYFPKDGNTVGTLLRKADKAMYSAKVSGRNSFRVYEDKMHSDEERCLQIENCLRKAIEKSELYLEFQPIVNLDDKRIAAIEALLRWDSAEFGFISPGEFIPLAEETGLIIPISEWVIKNACQTLNNIHNNGYPYLKMAINISAIHFKQDDFVERVGTIIKNSGVKRQHIILELTESMIMSKDNDVIKKLVNLKQLGIRIAIDDFGTGYSSLSYLHRFPIDILKIDQSFIKDIQNYKEDVAIVKTIIVLAKILNLSIVAEGVESKRQFDFLKRENCTNIQGFFITKALPYDELMEFLTDWDPALLQF